MYQSLFPKYLGPVSRYYLVLRDTLTKDTQGILLLYFWIEQDILKLKAVGGFSTQSLFSFSVLVLSRCNVQIHRIQYVIEGLVHLTTRLLRRTSSG